jgi:predicted DsbA family dithiol-disulfide isomerase
MQIQVFSDVVCPWCFIGLVRLDRALADLAIDATVVYRPFMIAPDTPPEGFNVAEDLRRKYGADPRKLWDRAEAEARASGLELDLARQAMSYPTDAAHTLIRHAQAKGTQRGLVRALFDTYFQEARDISSPDVLAPLAAQHGFAIDEARALIADPAERLATRRAVQEAYALGVRGAPTFVFDQAMAFSGAQPEMVFRDILEQVRGGGQDPA